MFSKAIELFIAGGPVMYVLLFASLFTVTVFIERLIFFKDADSGSTFVEEIVPLFNSSQYEKALKLCETSKGMNASILKKAISLKGESPEYIEKFLENEANISTADLRKRVPYLGVIVTLSPLLGLLGTVIGMINSFNVFSAQSGQPHAITGGVGEALIATATGLSIATLAMVCHSYFAQRMDTMVTDMEKAFTAFVTSLHRGKNNETA